MMWSLTMEEARENVWMSSSTKARELTCGFSLSNRQK